MQARAALGAPPCGCKPDVVGYVSIAQGLCCSEAAKRRKSGDSAQPGGGSSGLPDAGNNSNSSKGVRGADETELAMPRPCCSAAPLLDAALDDDNPDVVPACCS